MAHITSTTPATKWASYAAGALPVTFPEGRPKAIMINDAGNVVLIGKDGVQVTFTPAVGVPIQLRPLTIVSTTASAVIALFH